MIENFQWFAIRVTYSREMKLKKYLDSVNIKSFIPMHYIESTKNGQRKKILVPIIHNLIFIFSSRKILDAIKQKVIVEKIPIRYIMDKASNTPIIIPERDMQNFIAVSGSLDEQLLYLTDIEPMLGKGDRVRVIGGIFKGVEGEILRLKRDRRVVVSIKGIIAVATTFIHHSLLQKIDQKNTNC